MTVVSSHVATVTFVLEAPTVQELTEARAELARRLSHVVPFAPLTSSKGRSVRVITATIASPGLRDAISLRPRSGPFDANAREV